MRLIFVHTWLVWLSCIMMLGKSWGECITQTRQNDYWFVKPQTFLSDVKISTCISPLPHCSIQHVTCIICFQPPLLFSNRLIFSAFNSWHKKKWNKHISQHVELFLLVLLWNNVLLSPASLAKRQKRSYWLTVEFPISQCVWFAIFGLVSQL